MNIDYDYIEQSLKENIDECDKMANMFEVDELSDMKAKRFYVMNMVDIQTAKRENLKLLKDLYSTVSKTEAQKQTQNEELTLDGLTNLIDKGIA